MLARDLQACAHSIVNASIHVFEKGVLCCAVLCCAVLCCAVLCCAVLCCVHELHAILQHYCKLFLTSLGIVISRRNHATDKASLGACTSLNT